jgi:hypothetical protein
MKEIVFSYDIKHRSPSVSREIWFTELSDASALAWAARSFLEPLRELVLVAVVELALDEVDAGVVGLLLLHVCVLLCLTLPYREGVRHTVS